jgi:hypothetical protein
LKPGGDRPAALGTWRREAAGALAAFCVDRQLTPAAVHAKVDLTAEFQKRLREDGFELEWKVAIRPL